MVLAVDCTRCGFPIAAKVVGQKVSCPNCYQGGTVIQEGKAMRRTGISVGRNGIQTRISGAGSTIFAMAVGLFVGTLLGPEIQMASKMGRDSLRRKMEEKARS